MNVTHAKDRYVHNPKARAKLAEEGAPRSVIFQRKPKIDLASVCSAPPRKGRPNQARRHRLNPGRRSVEENRAARGIDKAAFAVAVMAAAKAAGTFRPEAGQ